MEYRREIDGLRALAVVPVILYHAGFGVFSGGYVGVDIFFVISGYLITSIILHEKKQGSFSIVRFYERRARRIWPALFLVLFACIPFAWIWLLAADMRIFSESLVSVLLFVSNLLFWKTSGYFNPTTELNALLHTWSLSVEEQFYLVFPLFIIAAWRMGSKRIVMILVMLSCISLAIAQWGVLHKPLGAFYLLPARFWELSLGSLIAFFLASGRKLQPRPGLEQALSLLGVSLVAYSIFFFSKSTPFPGLYALVPAAGAALIILWAKPNTLVGRVLSGEGFVKIGLLSYSAYLWHQPIFALAKHQGVRHSNSLAMGGLALLALVLAYFSWRFVEAPFRDKQRVSARQIFLGGAVCTLVLLAFGVVGILTKGFLLRFEPHDHYLAQLENTKEGRFVYARFGAARDKPFLTEDRRTKVLLIGDSFAQDLVNVLHEGESAFGKHIQISTRYVDYQCGNLLIDPREFLQHIEENLLVRCKGQWLHDDVEFKKRLIEADEVWFAADWQPWQAPLVAKSVKNVYEITKRPVKVFGTKGLKFELKPLLKLAPDVRHLSTGIAPEHVISVNRVLHSSLDKKTYVNLQNLLCNGEKIQCALFSRDQKLLSYDGYHLTRYGAQHVADNLSKVPELNYLRVTVAAPTDAPQASGF